MQSTESEKIKEMYGLLRLIPSEKMPRFLIFTNNEYIVSGKYNAHCSFSMYPNEEEFFRLTYSDGHQFRGKILEIFSKFEFIIDEMVRTHFKPDNDEDFDDFLISLDLFSKIKYLTKWGLINKEQKNNIIELKEVRNSLAHTWIGPLRYKQVPLNEASFRKFKDDLVCFWKYLLSEYRKYQPSIDSQIEHLRTLLEESDRTNKTKALK